MTDAKSSRKEAPLRRSTEKGTEEEDHRKREKQKDNGCEEVYIPCPKLSWQRRWCSIVAGSTEGGRRREESGHHQKLPSRGGECEREKQ